MTWREGDGENWKGESELDDLLAELKRPFDPREFRGNYILDGHTPVEERDLMKWGEWMSSHPKHVASTMVGSAWVSTVFLGIDHDFGERRRDHDPSYQPLIFETMVFYQHGKTKRRKGESMMDYYHRAQANGEYNHEVGRWRSWDEALAAHEAHVAKLRRRPKG